MYLRMLKKDLTDKKGLNIILFIFMILASVLIVSSAQLLFTSIVMGEKTYEKCNTSDITMVTQAKISDEEEQKKIREWFENIPEYDRMYIEEGVRCPGEMLEYVSDNGEKREYSYMVYIFSKVQTDRNIPYNMDDEFFTVPKGCVALPQNIMNSKKMEIGDKIHITTQMGNIYEFTVSDFYKEPSACFSCKLLFSDEDYKVLADDSPVKNGIYEIFLKNIEGDYADKVMDIASKFILDFEDMTFTLNGNKELYKTGDGIIGLVVSVVLSIVGVFMIFMIFVTVHFSLRTAVKREEKEIGIMKAIGVYSFSYRALFAVKYMAFAVIGGIIGMVIAMPLSDIMIDRFMIHIIIPKLSQRITIAIIMLILMILIMGIFILHSLRCMNKISVMDTIHGENKGERFKKIPGMFLHKKKLMNIPLFLALGDILGKIKRYAYLIFTYVVSVSMVLLVIQVKDSICSMEYVKKYLQYNALDFDYEISDAYYTKLYEKEGSIEGVYRVINNKFAENGIPAKMDVFVNQIAFVSYKDKSLSFVMKFGEPDTSYVEYVKGGKAPKLYNEVALACLSAHQAGIELGDIITVEYDKYNEDNISSKKVKEEFVVTAFFENQCFGVPSMIMGNEFGGAVANNGYTMFRNKLDCEEEEYEKYFEKMDSLFTDDEIKFYDKERAFNDIMGDYNIIFDLLTVIISVVVTIISMMITILYEGVFIEEETSDIAVMKSMGFDSVPVKLWHIFRMIILTVISYLIAVVLNITIGNFLLGRLVSGVIYVYDFQIIVRFFTNFVVVPLCLTVAVILSILPGLKSVGKIQIWRIRNE